MENATTTAVVKRKTLACTWEGCGKLCPCKSKLIVHMRTHTGEKPFICSWDGCESAFRRKEHLTIHKRTHTGDKPFKCDWDGCESAFSVSCSLTTHKRTHTGEKPYKCDWGGCDSAFSKSDGLTRHLRTHTGEKPFKCPWDSCESAFAQNSVLTSHRRTHTGEKPYKCAWGGCGQAFSTSGSLTNHRRTHTGEKPYACPDENCDERFTRSGHLHSHIKSWHTAEAAIRRKRQEERVAKALNIAGFARLIDAGSDVRPPIGFYRREYYVDNRCVDRESRHKSSRIDFVIGVNGGIVLLEVDEHQHMCGHDASLSCDMQRMNRIMVSWSLGNAAIPNILWLRYNPHIFKINGIPQKRVMKKDREAWLVSRLRKGVSDTLAIEYAYFDTNDAGVPLVVLHPGYHPMYREVATGAAVAVASV